MSGAEIIVQSTSADSSDKTLTVRCDGGKIAIGGGARVLGATSSSDADAPTGVAIVASYPNGTTGEKAPSWTAAAKEVTAVSVDWRLSVYAVCVIATD